MRRGYTLIEMLGVVALIALIASTASVSWSTLAEASQARSTKASIRDALSRARLSARSLGGAIVSFSTHGDSISVRDERGMILRETDWPSGLKVSLETGEGERVIVFDRFGRTSDFVIAIEGPESMEVLRGSGISGWIREEVIR